MPARLCGRSPRGDPAKNQAQDRDTGTHGDTDRLCLFTDFPRSFLPLFEACLVLGGCPASCHIPPSVPKGTLTQQQGRWKEVGRRHSCLSPRPSAWPSSRQAGSGLLLGVGQSHSYASGPARWLAGPQEPSGLGDGRGLDLTPRQEGRRRPPWPEGHETRWPQPCLRVTIHGEQGEPKSPSAALCSQLEPRPQASCAVV